MSDSILYEMLGDSNSVVAAIDAIIASLGNLSKIIDQFATTASSLTTLDDTLANLGSTSTATQEQVDGLQSVINSLNSTIEEDTAMISSLQEANANLTAQLTALTGEFDTAGSSSSIFSSAISSVQEMLQGLIPTEEQAQAALSNFKDGLASIPQNIGGMVSGVKGGISSFIDFGSKVGMTIFGMQNMANMAYQLGNALISPAATAETTQLSFVTLLHSTKLAHQEMVDLNNFAAKTPMQTQWIDTAAAKMLAFGFGTKDVIPDITAIGDSLSGLGKLSEASLNSIVDIFGKIRAQGKLTGGDMMQLSTWGIPAWQALSDAMHKPIPELQKMVSAGLIPAGVAIKDLQQGMEHTFGGGMAKQADTFTGLMSTLASNWQIAMASFGSPVLKLAEQELGKLGDVIASPGFQAFATQVGQQIADVLSQIGSFAASIVVPAFQQLGVVVQQVAGYLQSEAFAGVVADFQTVGNQIYRMLLPALQAIAPIANQVFSSIGPILTNVVIPAIDQVVFQFGQLLLYLNENQPVMQVVTDALIGIGVAFTVIKIGQFVAMLPALIAQLGAWAVAQWGVASATIATAAPFILIGAAIALVVAGVILAIQHWGEISKWLQGVWASFSSWFMGILGAIGNFFSGVWNGIASFFKSVWSGAISSFQSTTNAVSSWWHGFWQGVQNVFKAVWDGIVNVVKIGGQILFMALFGPIVAIVNLFQWLYQHNYYFQALIDSIVGFVRAGVAWLVNAWNVTVQAIVTAWQWTASTASGIWNAVVGAIRNAVSAVIGWLQSVWGTITGWIAERWSYLSAVAKVYWAVLSAGIRAVVSAVIGWLQSVWNTAIAWLAGKWNSLVGLATAAWNGVVGVFQGIWGMISGPLSGLWNNIVNWFSNLGSQASSWGSNLIQGFINGITSMIGNVASAVQNIAGTVAKSLGFHSPAEEGPGKDADVWGPNLISMFADGIESGQARVRNAVLKNAQILTLLNTPLSSNISVSTPSSSLPVLATPQSSVLGSSGGGSNQTTYLLTQMVSLLSLMASKPQGTSANSTYMNNTINAPGISNPQQMFQAFEKLGGFGYEDLSRSGYGI